MNYGLYLSAAGALTNLHKQDVYANNLANVNTVGFKPDQVFTRQRLPERLESGVVMSDPNLLLERLGGGQFVDPTYTNLTQGNLEKTGNPLDVAISGDGFFAVRTGAGAGEETLRLTRDGRFTVDENGRLVMSTTGMPVLGANNNPIQLDRDQPVRIESTGEVFQDGRLAGQIQITMPDDPRTLRKAGDGLMAFREGADRTRVPANARLMQGHVEQSGVDPVMAMNAMIGASKSVAGNAQMMQYHDHIMDQAINTFGRVA